MKEILRDKVAGICNSHLLGAFKWFSHILNGFLAFQSMQAILHNCFVIGII